MTEPAGELEINGHVTQTMIVHANDTEDGSACHFFLFKATVHGEELVIGLAQEASAARTMREQLDKYIYECDNDLETVLKGFLEADDG